jgi:hypothetical protein
MLARMAMRNYASFAPSGKIGRKKCPRVAGNRLLPPIGGRSGKSRPLRRWQMKAILG